MDTITPVLVQANFRGRDDDVGLNVDTWNGGGAQDADWSQDVDQNFRVRFVIQETAGGEAKNETYQIEYNLAGGGWNILTASSPIQWSTTTEYINLAATTQLLGSGSFQAGDGLTGTATTGLVTLLSTETEFEFVVSIDSAQVTNGQTFDLRLTSVSTGALDTYTNTPTITVVEAVAITARITVAEADVTHSEIAGRVTVAEADVTSSEIAGRVTVAEADVTSSEITGRVTVADADVTHSEIVGRVTVADADVTYSEIITTGKITVAEADVTSSEITGRVTVAEADVTSSEIVGRVTVADADVTHSEITGRVTVAEADVTSSEITAKITVVEADVTRDPVALNDTGSQNSPTNDTALVTVTVAASDSLIVVCVGNAQSTTINSVTDTIGNNYAAAGGSEAESPGASIWYALNTGANAANIISVNGVPTSTIDWSLTAYVFELTDPIRPIGDSSAASGTGSGSISAGALTTDRDFSVVVGCWSNGSNWIYNTPGAGQTNLLQIGQIGVRVGSTIELTNEAGSNDQTLTINKSANWTACAVEFHALVTRGTVTVAEADVTHSEIAAKITVADVDVYYSPHGIRTGNITVVDVDVTHSEITGRVTVAEADVTHSELAGRVTVAEADVTHSEIAGRVTVAEADVTYTETAVASARVTVADVDVTYSAILAAGKITVAEADVTHSEIAGRVTVAEADVTSSEIAGRVTVAEADVTFELAAAKITVADVGLTYSIDAPAVRLYTVDEHMTYVFTVPAARIVELDVAVDYFTPDSTGRVVVAEAMLERSEVVVPESASQFYEDLSVFFGGKFSESCLVGGLEVRGIFDDAFASVEEIEGSRPEFTAATADLPTITDGLSFSRSSTGESYSIIGSRPSGNGITVLILHEV